jgi:hypothetical protein
VAGIEPVEPAAIVQPSGGAACSRAPSQRQHAPRRGRQLVFRRQQLWPGVMQHIQKAGDALPVFRHFGRQQVFQFPQIDALGFDFVHHFGKAVGQHGRLCER